MTIKPKMLFKFQLSRTIANFLFVNSSFQSNRFYLDFLGNVVFWQGLEGDVFVEADVGPEVDAKISDVRRGKEVALRRHCQ